MELEFKELEFPENSRTYLFPDGETVTVDGVTSIAVSESGTHRLNDEDGDKWIITTGWLAILIDADEWSF